MRASVLEDRGFAPGCELPIYPANDEEEAYCLVCQAQIFRDFLEIISQAYAPTPLVPEQSEHGF